MFRELNLALHKAGSELGHQVSTGLDRLKNLRESKAFTALFFLWCLGIMGDAYSTVHVITQSNGALIEGNPAAIVVMDAVGLYGWVLLASLMCVAFMIPSMGKVTGMYSRALFTIAIGVLAGKLFFSVTNYLLWLDYLAVI